jgi:hypothetical protein
MMKLFKPFIPLIMKSIILLVAVIFAVSVYSIHKINIPTDSREKHRLASSFNADPCASTSLIFSEMQTEKILRETPVLTGDKPEVYLVEIGGLELKHYNVIFNSSKGKLRNDLDHNNELFLYFLNPKNALLPYKLKDLSEMKTSRPLVSFSLQSQAKVTLPCNGNFKPHNLYFKIGANAIS